MHPIEAFVKHPVKVAVGVILVALFGVISIFRMPMQLTPEVERPTISITTRWPGASPQEVEKEIVQPQEEQLQSVEGVTKMSSQCQDSVGTVNLEFAVGTNMEEAVLKVNSRLQQVREYPIDADKPVIATSNSSNSPIAWFILSVKPPTDEQFQKTKADLPALAAEIDHVQASPNPGLQAIRLKNLIEKHPELAALAPADIDVTRLRKFAVDQIEARFERVEGVANSDVLGGRDPELQVIVDPKRLAVRGLTLTDVRDRLRNQNIDTSGGDLWDGKRRWTVRTLGQYIDVADVENVVLAIPDGQPVLVKDVAEVRLDHKKPDGFVRRFGTSNISLNVQRDNGANVLEVMDGLKQVVKDLNSGVLASRGLVLNQVYDETEYIRSSITLVNQNIMLGSALTVIVLLLFLHLEPRTVLMVPALAATAVAALSISPWFFVVTLGLIVVGGFWFARGALVVALAIPISIVGTFLILAALGRSLNVISLAGLAFAVGMLVDNAVVVLENIYRYHQSGMPPTQAAVKGTKEVWGAVLASTLTTLFVFVPIVFLQGEAGQLFADIALAISAAVGLSLIVSVVVVPMASSRILATRGGSQAARVHSDKDQNIVERIANGLARQVTDGLVGINRFIQKSTWRQIGIAVVMMLASVFITLRFFPAVEYLPNGNRNLAICLIFPPPGYNLEQMVTMGERVEDKLRPYWDIDPGITDVDGKPTLADFFYVARGRSLFVGLRAVDPLRAADLVELVREELQDQFPGSFVVASQSSLFERGLAGGRAIDIEITGAELPELVALGGRIMGMAREAMPEGTQMRPEPSLDLSSPELHVVAKPITAGELAIDNRELGYAVNAIIDGAYVTDYFIGGDKIDLVLWGDSSYSGRTQDLESQYIAARGRPEPVRLDSVARVSLGAGPEQVNHRERRRAITITVTPPVDMPLADAITKIETQVLQPLLESDAIGDDERITLSGTADKLRDTWMELRWNVVVALIITYLLMAALFESWLHPLVIIVSVPLGAVGGVLGLRGLSAYLVLQGEPPQSLDVLTMLGFVILIGTVVNNAILIVHQALVLIREEGREISEAVVESVSTRIRPIFMTTLTTVIGLAPLVFFPGAGSELYRGLGAVLLGGLIVSTLFTLVLIPALFTVAMRAQDAMVSFLGWGEPIGVGVPAVAMTTSPATATMKPREYDQADEVAVEEARESFGGDEAAGRFESRRTRDLPVSRRADD